MDTRTIAMAEAAIKARIERGMELYRSGSVSAHGDAYVVLGTAHNYTVFLIGGEPRCDCPDYRERCRDAGHACKHGYAVVTFEVSRGCHKGPKIIRHC
jgi:uncharacterized Zn finger protein